MAGAKKAKSPQPAAEPLRLDFGCGPNKVPGFKGVDAIAFAGVDYVLNVGRDVWPFDDNSVDEAHASHFLEHLTAPERCHFFNELYRVLKPAAGCLIRVPHWCSNRAYGDPTHQWPPVSEMTFQYLNKAWRMSQAPHTDKSVNPQGYDCDFDHGQAPDLRADLLLRNQEYQQFAYNNYKEAAQDLQATVIKRG